MAVHLYHFANKALSQCPDSLVAALLVWWVLVHVNSVDSYSIISLPSLVPPQLHQVFWRPQSSRKHVPAFLRVMSREKSITIYEEPVCLSYPISILGLIIFIQSEGNWIRLELDYRYPTVFHCLVSSTLGNLPIPSECYPHLIQLVYVPPTCTHRNSF